MKKIVLLLPCLALTSCFIEAVEEPKSVSVERIVEVPLRPTSERVLSYFFEPTSSVSINKNSNETCVGIYQNRDDVFMVVKTDVSGASTYSIQKYDVKQNTLNKVIDNLLEVKSISFSNQYIFVSQDNSVLAYDIASYGLVTTIGQGNAENFRMNKVHSLYTTPTHLVVRDLRNIRFYKLEDITPANSKKVPVIVKSGTYTADEAAITIFENVIHFKRIQNSNKRYQRYTLNPEGIINEGQTANEGDISTGVAPTIVSFASYSDEFYAIYEDGTFGRVDAQTFEKGKTYQDYNGGVLKIQNFVVVDEVLYALNQDGNNLYRFERKNLTYRKY